MQHLENGRICKKGLDELSKMVYYYKAQKTCRSGGTADTLSSGGSGSNPVRVQISSSAPG